MLANRTALGSGVLAATRGALSKENVRTAKDMGPAEDQGMEKNADEQGPDVRGVQPSSVKADGGAWP
jgi:hypothetical protein